MAARLATIMRAIRVHQFGGPEVLKLETNVPVPKPAAGQVLVKVYTAGVNPVETYIRSGTHSRKPDLPYTPGGDCAGIVEDVGEGVTKFKKGDRVFTFGASGTYAEYAAADEAHTFKLPSNVGYNEGAALGVPYFTAVRSIVHKAHAKPGEVMLVHGASGGVGLASCQIGRAMGLRVLGTAGTKEGLDLALQNGAHEVFNHRDPDYLEKIQKSTGQGPDIILEMLSNVNLQKDFEIAKLHGRIVIIGARGPLEIMPRVAMHKELQINGVMLFAATKDEFAEMGAYLVAGLEQGTLRPVVGRQFKLEQAADAHREVIEHSQGSNGKIVLVVQE